MDKTGKLPVGTKKNKSVTRRLVITAVSFPTAFFVVYMLRIVFRGFAFTNNLSILFSAAIVISWTINVYFRVKAGSMRRLIMLSSGLVLLFYYLNVLRYSVFSGNELVAQYLHYLCYFSIIFFPGILFLISLRIISTRVATHNAADFAVFLLSAAFFSLVATNNFHHLAFREADGRGGPLLFVCFIWMFCLYVASYIIIVRGSKTPESKRFAWTSLIPVAVALLMVAGLHHFPDVFSLFSPGYSEIFGSTVVVYLEITVALDLIPSNTGYSLIFPNSFLPAVITDETGRIVTGTQTMPEITQEQVSHAIRESFTTDEGIRLSSFPVSGGYCISAADLSVINGINAELEKTIKDINYKNRLLQQSNKILEESSSLRERNELYDRIARKVQPQTEEIRSILGGENPSYERVSLLLAFIKRRLNMELQASGKEELDIQELSYAVTESLGCLSLSGIGTAVAPVRQALVPCDTIFSAYEFFENVLENTPSGLRAVNTVITVCGNELTVKMMLALPFSAAFAQSLTALCPQACTEEADGECIVSAVFGKGEIV